MMDVEEIKNEKVKKNIENWKRQLLDFTKRNKLIYFKYDKKNMIRIRDDMEYISNVILNEEKMISIQSLELDFDISNNEDEKSLNRLSNKLRQRANTTLKEKGINILYLCFGFLKWQEAEYSNLDIYSPLLLVPVSIIKRSKDEPYYLGAFENEIKLNPTIQFKIKNDFGIEIPDIENEEISIREYLTNLKLKISGMKKWDIIDEMYVGLFSFNKISMYHDLIRYEKEITEHGIVSNIASGELTYTDNELDKIHNINLNYTSSNCYQILDADSSQQEAIETAKKGYSFVIQGPPGTGKSQTITNVIAECLAQGKKILFVSEKMAALDVVYKRLKSIGLSDFCLELHSSKANKKAVISELYSQYSSFLEVKNVDELFFKSFDNIKSNLDEYVEVLHKEHIPLNKSAFWLHGELSKLNDVKDVNFQIKNFLNLDLNKIFQMQSIVKELEVKQKEISIYNDSLWKNTILSDYTMNKKNEIFYELTGFKENISNTEKSVHRINNNYGMNIKSVHELINFRQALLNIDDTSEFNDLWFDKIKNGETFALVNNNIDLDDKYRNVLSLVKRKYREQIGDIEINNAFDSLQFISENLSYDYCNEFHKKDVRLSVKEILQNYKNKFDDFKIHLCELNKIFGENYEHKLSSLKKLVDFLEIVINGDSVPVRWINDNEFTKKNLPILINECKDFHNNLNNMISKLNEYYNDDILSQDVEHIFEFINKNYSNKNKSNLEHLYYNYDEIIDKFNELSKILKDISNCSIELFNLLGVNKELSIINIKLITNLIKSMVNTTYCTKEWFNVHGMMNVKKESIELEKQINDINFKLNEVRAIFNENILESDIKQLHQRFNSEYLSAFRFLNSKYRRDRKILMMNIKNKNTKNLSFEQMYNYVEKLNLLQKSRENLKNNSTRYINVFGPLYNNESTNLDTLKDSVNSAEQFLMQCTKIGFNEKLVEIITNRKYIDIIDVKRITLNNLLNKFDIEFKKLNEIYNILTEEYETMEIGNVLKEIEKEYDKIILTTKNIILFSKYKKYKNEDFKIFEENLKRANDIKSNLNILRDRRSNYEDILGALYSGLETNWDNIDKLVEWINKVHDNFKILPNDTGIYFIKHFTQCNKEEFFKLGMYFKQLKLSLEGINSSINEVSNIIKLDREAGSTSYAANIINDKISDQTIENIDLFIDNLLVEVNNIDTITDNILEFREANCFENFSQFKLEFQMISSLIKTKKQLLELEEINKKYFGDFYRGINTCWIDIKKNIIKAENIIEILHNSNIVISSKFIYTLCNKNDRENLNRLKDSISIIFNNLQHRLKYFYTIFLPDTIFFNKVNFDKLDFNDNINILSTLIKQLESLELVINFKNIFKQAEDVGISDFFVKIFNEKDLSDNITDLFNKRLFTIILDIIYSKDKTLKTFDRQRYDRYLKEFREMDRQQIVINSTRVKNILLNNRNSGIKNRQLRYEINTLDHENSKKKRHLPIRRLFSNMPNLLLELKPCMLMSPLSVSEFIDLNNIKYDVVIFDEASQICPEEAIGSMIRGKQIIIAGDNKQLPPTRFFDVASDEEEFDNEETEESIVFESILDLCSDVMPQKRLLWHYRSRHESLIAFSNRNYYNDTLYTFPNSSNSRHLGVKFSYVKDGLYDRSNTRTNAKEAEHVANLVFQHFKENPRRSLGVITFSTAQMDAVNNIIEEKRKLYPEYEKFFAEDIEDAFFVKNLENVQGDERDTIIISVGYGKDNRNILSHNFGPINKAGGERRLNVAITRAKYELYLVASITDNDINIRKTQSIGVKLLKEYLNYARMGNLQEKITNVDEKVFDSPLEEDIYNSITELGYDVDTQVGCSGYKIDLAVIDPKNESRYICGIECDGATYHSSKTARDRDRLRQDVLEGLGWNIYRIWSQDWFKRKKFEIQKLNMYLKALPNEIEDITTYVTTSFNEINDINKNIKIIKH